LLIIQVLHSFEHVDCADEHQGMEDQLVEEESQVKELSNLVMADTEEFGAVEGPEADEVDSLEDAEEADDPPSRKKQKVYVPPEDCNYEHMFYKSGLRAVASIIAYGLRHKFPQLTSSVSQLPAQYPVWVSHYSSRGMCPPTETLVEMVNKMDTIFIKIHGDSIQKGKGVARRFIELITSDNASYPKEVVAAFAVLRILIRVRALNKRNKNQKQEEADAAKPAKNKETSQKVKKNSRQSRVNKIWKAGKR
jgi:cell division protein FtsL